MAMWNAVLGAFANETRIEYYYRCRKIVTAKAVAAEIQYIKKRLFKTVVIKACC